MSNADHNKGQSDGSQGKYEPPVPISPLDEVICPEHNLREWREKNGDYDKGWQNGHKQG